MDPIDREKSVVILNMQSLGFIDEKTDKYCARPNATEFILELSRKFHLATVTETNPRTEWWGFVYDALSS